MQLMLVLMHLYCSIGFTSVLVGYVIVGCFCGNAGLVMHVSYFIDLICYTNILIILLTSTVLIIINDFVLVYAKPYLILCLVKC